MKARGFFKSRRAMVSTSRVYSQELVAPALTAPLICSLSTESSGESGSLLSLPLLVRDCFWKAFRVALDWTMAVILPGFLLRTVDERELEGGGTRSSRRARLVTGKSSQTSLSSIDKARSTLL